MAIRNLVTTAKTYKPYTGERGLYVSRIPDEFSVDKIVNLVHTYALCDMTEYDINEMHCTIMYSPNPNPPKDMEGINRDDIHPVVLPCSAYIVRIEFWPGHDEDGYLVACLESKPLQAIHRLWKLRGGVPTFPDYRPHITLKTPFDDSKELTHKLKSVNRFLESEPILIRLINETVEDIKSLLDVEIIEACSLK